MNKHCQCTEAGFCTRHLMMKNDVLFNMCKGVGNNADCGLKYWIGWERGQLGATAPAKPILKPDKFCDQERNGIVELPCKGCGTQRPIKKFDRADAVHLKVYKNQTLGEGEAQKRLDICNSCPLMADRICEGCGCNVDEKVTKSEEKCPIYKWFRYGRKRRPFDNEVKTNLIMHLMPLKRSDNWMINLNELSKRIDLFNHKKLLAICFEDEESRKSLHTVDPQLVIDYSSEVGIEWDEIKVFKNNPKIREGVSFPWLLESVESIDPNEITFFCHGKSSTHDPNSITSIWRDAQYMACLDRFKYVLDALEQYAMIGAFKKYGQFTTPENNRWHYSGTFYWFRNDEVFRANKNWRKLDNAFFCVESWPGRMFRPEETACILGEDILDLYKEEHWPKIYKELELINKCNEI